MSLKNLSVKNKIHKRYKVKLNNPRVNEIYKKFENSFKLDKNFIVAVSGGADSLALAFLTKLFALKNNLNPKYYIVDHKLRKESTSEALKVKKILNSSNISSKILTIKGKKPQNKIQSFAREKRYDLLFSECKKFKINNLILGHHMDDILEGKIFGLFRGRMEFGPRALGSRSIIGDPRSQSTQTKMNLKIKFRESFRPFAPFILKDHVHNWFENASYDNKYMLFVNKLKKERRLNEESQFSFEGEMLDLLNKLNS